MEGQTLKDLCASYQRAIVDALALKCSFALTEDIPLVVGGGVACNSSLREVFSKKFKNVHFVPPRFCTDNGAMIANYAFITREQAIPYPQCLKLDARGSIFTKANR
jgi:N6-L-threonylcarbamoyladenine synthase